MKILPPGTGRGSHCEPILRALPDWFGIETALMEYVEAAERWPTILAQESDQTVGFLTIQRHFPEAAEIHCVGVLPSHHRRGVGQRMQELAEAVLGADGVRVLQVKTLADTVDHQPYARTRAFYRAMGFVPLEVFPTLWQPWNPCLVLVKSL